MIVGNTWSQVTVSMELASRKEGAKEQQNRPVGLGNPLARPRT